MSAGAFLGWVLLQEGKLYRWGAKGPDRFDCSGLVTAGLKAIGGPDWTQTHNSQRLFDVLPMVERKDTLPGDLAFYGPPNRITHVMILSGDGRVFGASGGNSNTINDEIAKRMNAKIQYRPKVMYRPDFRGYRRAAK